MAKANQALVLPFCFSFLKVVEVLFFYSLSSTKEKHKLMAKLDLRLYCVFPCVAKFVP